MPAAPRPLLVASLLAAILSAAQPAGADDGAQPPVPNVSFPSDEAIEKLLGPIRDKHKVPGLIAGIVGGNGLRIAGAVGVRKAGSPELMTVNDKVHLGSNTKAITATLLATFVEESKLSWESTVGDVFSDSKGELHADYLPVTLRQLLTHRAGLPANASYGEVGTGPLIEQRRALLKKVLGQPPVHAPGSKFLYSNVGYIVAGHMAEHVTGKPWEELLQSRLFEPLQMTSAGFGFPGTKDQVDQPWGHSLLLGQPLPQQLDNPAALGPAGTVHCSLSDWARFIALHLQGAQRTAPILKPETFQVLQTPLAGEDYALGWVVSDRPWAGGKTLSHTGSNTMWFASVWIAPAKKVAYLAVTNQGMPAGATACNAAITALIGMNDKTAAPDPSIGLGGPVMVSTPGGVSFGVIGRRPAAPAPTLFVFANDVSTTLESDDYNKVGKALLGEGYLCVSLDLPCHGRKAVAGEPAGLEGWAATLKNGEDPIELFMRQATSVLDFLVAERLADPRRIAVCGTSRGGYAALRFAAAEPRVRCVAAFAPVTNLPSLTEFKGLEDNALTNAASLRMHADKLASRPVWMCIGNNDERVDTDQAIAFSRAVVKASAAVQKEALIELHVMTSRGHTIHPTAHAEAAAWIAAQMKPAGD